MIKQRLLRLLCPYGLFSVRLRRLVLLLNILLPKSRILPMLAVLFEWRTLCLDS